MKCPYRKSKTNKFDTVEGKIVKSGTVTFFEECYEDDCPYFVREKNWRRTDSKVCRMAEAQCKSV